MAKYTGATSTTKDVIQLDAGAIYKNFTVGTDTPSSASAKLIGATQGGATIAIVPENRQIAVDGLPTYVEGYEVIDGWNATLSASILDITADALKLALGTATTSSAPTGYTKLVLNSTISSSDYVDSITWIGKVSGKDKPMAITLKNVMNLNGLNFTVKDKAEGVIPVVLTAHYDISSLDNPPVEVFVPTA